MLNTGCTEVPATRPIPLKKLFGRLLCVRKGFHNFLDLERPDIHGQCYNYEHQIWGDPNAPPSRQTCIESYDHCPITDIVIVDNEDVDKYSQYMQITLEFNKTLLFTSSYKAMPVVQFKLTEGTPWMFEDEYDVTKNRYRYKLVDQSEYKGWLNKLNDENLYDERYRYIEGISEYDLFKDNGVLDVLNEQSKYNTHKHSSDYKFNFYQKSYIRWKIACENVGLTREDIYQKVKNVEQAWFWQSLFNQVCFVNLIVTGFIFGIVYWIEWLYTIIFVPSTRNKWLAIWAKITNTIFILVSFVKIVFIYIWVNNVDRYEYSIKTIENINWSDDLTSQSFQIVGNSIFSSRLDNLLVLKVTMLTLAFEIINYLTPIIVDLRKSQSYVYELRK